MDDQIGTVAPGKWADLILVEGNPLDDAFALERVSHVWQHGELVKAPALSAGGN
jgi:imidazolonepropionase-like amidohydrolase